MKASRSPRLLSWLESPEVKVGVSVAEARHDWQFTSYAELAGRVGQAVTVLRDAGVQRNDVVALFLPNGPDFIASLFACLSLGAAFAPVAPPLVLHDTTAYDDHAAALLRIAQPRLVLTTPELRDRLSASHPQWRFDVVGGADVPRSEVRTDATGDIALLQFTSGSTGIARGVMVTRENLEANINALRTWLNLDESTGVATWLPVHHDMGLVGCTLLPVTTGTPISSMRPEQFVRRPLRWLECFSEGQCDLSASPPFGLAHVLRRVSSADISRLDLRRWRGLVVGAERITPGVLADFARHLEPAGFDGKALVPAYGLAEATLAVTGSSPTVLPRSVPAPANGVSGDAVVSVVSCGRPLDGTRVTIVDEDGAELPAGQVGEIVVQSGSVTAGYLAGSRLEGSTRLDDGRLFTGDAGFLVDDELYVIGRFGDSMKVRGQAIFAEDIDAAVRAVPDVVPGRYAALLGLVDDQPTVVVVVEGREIPHAEIERAVRSCAPDAAIEVVTGPRGTLKLTTSGKPRRRLMWAAYRDGTLGNPEVRA